MWDKGIRQLVVESDALKVLDRILKYDRAVSQEIILVLEIVRMINRE